MTPGFIVKSAGRKGKGLFARRLYRKGERIFSVNLAGLPRRKDNELTAEEREHIDYAGRGHYVVSHHPYVYMNHSCDPTVIIQHHTIARSSFFALRDIQKGEELTYDYGVNAMDQLGNKDFVMSCSCGSRDCRKTIHMNYFRQPITIQRFYWPYLPPSLRRRYRNKLKS